MGDGAGRWRACQFRRAVAATRSLDLGVPDVQRNRRTRGNNLLRVLAAPAIVDHIDRHLAPTITIAIAHGTSPQQGMKMTALGNQSATDCGT